jgi:hypothetical protein
MIRLFQFAICNLHFAICHPLFAVDAPHSSLLDPPRIHAIPMSDTAPTNSAEAQRKCGPNGCPATPSPALRVTPPRRIRPASPRPAARRKSFVLNLGCGSSGSGGH